MRKKSSRKITPLVNSHWIVGLLEPPIPINPLEGRFFMCMVLENELVIGTTFIEEKSLDNFTDEIKTICKKPGFGAPRCPKTILFDNRTEYSNVNILLNQTEITPGKAPELDELVEDFFEHLQREMAGDTWDYKEYPSEIMEQYFIATSQWVKLAPWRYIYDTDLFEINSKKHNLKNWFASVMGNAGQSYGIIFFPSLSSYKNFIRMSRSQVTSSREIHLKQPIIALNFESIHLAETKLRKAAMVKDWPVVSTDFFPTLEIYSKNNTRGTPPGKVYMMVTEIIQSILQSLTRYDYKSIDDNLQPFEQEIIIDDSDFTLNFPVHHD